MFKERNEEPNERVKAVPIVVTIEVVVRSYIRTHIVNFLVVEKLGTSVVLRGDFCDVHVGVVKQRLTVVEMYDGSTVRSSKNRPNRIKQYHSRENKRSTREESVHQQNQEDKTISAQTGNLNFDGSKN